jgi:hypothetical protein
MVKKVATANNTALTTKTKTMLLLLCCGCSIFLPKSLCYTWVWFMASYLLEGIRNEIPKNTKRAGKK